LRQVRTPSPSLNVSRRQVYALVRGRLVFAAKIDAALGNGASIAAS